MCNITPDDILDFFKDLDFNEEIHQYKVKGKILPSVSSLIGQWHPTFDSERMSGLVARKRGCPQEQILKEWADINKTACDRGHRTHAFGERYVFDRSLEPSCGPEHAIVKFWNDLPEHIIPYMVEVPMYHKKYAYSGTCDLLLYNTKKNSFILGDYKTNKDLFKNYRKQTMLGPFKSMLDHLFNHYQLQLSYYQLLIEQLGLPVSQRFILWLKDDSTYEFHNCKDLTKTLEDTFSI